MPVNRRDFIKAASTLLLQLGLTPARGFSTETLQRAAASSPGANPVGSLAQLLEGFASPADAVRPGGYWWWFNTLMDKAGITRDMEEFRDKGIGEVLLVNSAASDLNKPVPHGPRFLSDEWLELFRFSLEEAQRCGIKVGFNLCTGWCMGGPWIEPRESGRWFLQSRLPVTGPVKFSDKLPLPGNRDGYDNVSNPPGVNDYIDLPLEKLDYRDTAVTAVRVAPGGKSSLDGERKDLLPAKSNRMDASNWTLARIINEKPLIPWENNEGDTPVAVADVVNLTDKMQADGHLDWDVPEGDWVIIRTGHRMTGSKVYLGLPGGDGLSIDWLNRSGTDKQFEVLGKKLLEIARPYVGNTLIYFADDSFEDGFPNWTENILEQFSKYRGYDATPYLPVLAGFIVGSAEISDRFLYDYRRTVADLLADEHYSRFRDLCHEAGLLVQNESAGPSRSGTMCMDTLKNLGRSDLPAGEFWLGRRYGMPEEEDPSLGYGQTRLEGGQNKNTKMVSSGAHVYGKNLVMAESFTTTARMHWIEAPHNLKYAADRAFCEGVNRIMIHTTTGTRPQDGKPGVEYYAGTHFNPNVTWWNYSAPFLQYMARCQHLLRAGLFVADVLYYGGDWAPNYIPAKHTDPSLGKGYDYDVCNDEVLLTRASVKDGRITLPDGMSYAVLVLPERNSMPVPVIKKLKELYDAGAVIVGSAPTAATGLKNYPECDDELRTIAAKMWGADDPTEPRTNPGGGKLFAKLSVREALAATGVHPDFAVDDDSAFIDFFHRRTADADIYYLLNRKTQPEVLKATFRIAPGRTPYLLDAATGQARALRSEKADGNRSTITLEFGPRESYFILFAKPGESLPGAMAPKKKLFPAWEAQATLHGPWKVSFDAAWFEKGTSTVQEFEFPALQDWSQHEDPRIRHFSGTARYTKTFTLTAEQVAEGNLWLDLGEVRDIISVTFNGSRNPQILWHAPWRIDLSDRLEEGVNILQMEVTNLWPNRMIGDAALPEDERMTYSNIEFKPTDPLQPSGLLGPVRLVKQLWA